jgi:hypothetical protein
MHFAAAQNARLLRICAEVLDLFLDKVEIFLTLNINPIRPAIRVPDRIVGPLHIKFRVTHWRAVTLYAMRSVKLSPFINQLLVYLPIFIIGKKLSGPFRRS